MDAGARPHGLAACGADRSLRRHRTGPDVAISVLGCPILRVVFRNIPLLLQMFAWFFMVPELLPTRLGFGSSATYLIPSSGHAVLALALYTSGRLGELFRAGLQAVPRGQREATAAASMNEIQTLCYVVVP
jgi:ABC-type amino acid transport system permease subunit